MLRASMKAGPTCTIQQDRQGSGSLRYGILPIRMWADTMETHDISRSDMEVDDQFSVTMWAMIPRAQSMFFSIGPLVWKVDILACNSANKPSFQNPTCLNVQKVQIFAILA